MFGIKFVEKIKAHILCSNNFFLKILAFMSTCGNMLYSQKDQRWH